MSLLMNYTGGQCRYLSGTFNTMPDYWQRDSWFIRNRIAWSSPYHAWPEGYSVNSLIRPVSFLGFASARLTADSTVAASIRGAGILSALLASDSFLSATYPYAGYNLSANLAGEGFFNPLISSIGYMTSSIQAGAQPSAVDIAGEVWQTILESGHSAQGIMRLLAAFSAGLTSIGPFASGATVAFRDLNDTKDRIVASMYGSERASITRDET
jgi:hypothetical protein